jgi:hypothetical protein
MSIIVRKNSETRFGSTIVLGSGLTATEDVNGLLTIDTATFGPLWFNVLDYGAVGDGVANDTSAINTAIAACVSAGGGTVYFPAGDYSVTGTTYALLVDGNNVRLLGDHDTWIVARSGIAAGTDMLRVNSLPGSQNRTDIVVENMGFNADTRLQMTGVRGYVTTRLSILNCRFKRFRPTSFANPGYGIWVGGNYTAGYSSPFAWASTIPTGFSSQTMIRGCRFYDGNDGTNGAESILAIWTDGLVISNCDSDGWSKGFYGLGPNRRVVVDNMMVQNAKDNGMRVEADSSVGGGHDYRDIEDIVFTNCTVRNSGVDGIRFDGVKATCLGCTSEFNAGSGIKMDYGAEVVLAHNVCNSNTGYGIALSQFVGSEAGFPAHKNVTIQSNICLDNGQAGIGTFGGSFSNTVIDSGIRIVDNQCGRNAYSGIRMFDADATCMIADNVCYNNGAASSSDNAGIIVVASVMNSGGMMITRNRCYDTRGSSGFQAIGIKLVAASGKTLATTRVVFNDLSDTPDISSPSITGRAIVTDGSAGTSQPHVLMGNLYRNVTWGVNRAAITTGVLRSTDIIIQHDENGAAYLPKGLYIGDGVTTHNDMFTFTLLTDTGAIQMDADGIGNYRIFNPGTGSFTFQAVQGIAQIRCGSGDSILFTVGSSPTWSIDANGHLVPSGNRDIGSAAAPVRAIYGGVLPVQLAYAGEL